MLSTSLVFLVKLAIVVGTPISNNEHQSASVIALRERLKNDFPETYMMEDYWLTNWLKPSDFNVQNAASKIKQYLQLRMHDNMAQILVEDWSEMRALFPYSRNTTDKNGRPVVYLDLSQWDLASFVTTEDAANHLIRYLEMIAEESEAHVRQLRADGRNDITQLTGLFNVGEFNAKKYLCKECGNLFAKCADTLEPQAAANMERAIFVNVPTHFKPVYFLFNEDTRKFIHLHGQDQEHLEKVLVAYIDRDQIPKGVLNEILVKDNSEGFLTWDKEL